jgi:hypothetical protein
MAFGFLPAIIGTSRWIVVAESAEAAPILATLATWIPEAKPATAELAPFVVLADARPTTGVVRTIHDGKEPSLAVRDDFRRYRSLAPGGVLGFHLDVGRLAPRIARFGLDKKNDAGAVLFASHVVHALKTANTLSGRVSLTGGASLDLFAEIEPVPAQRAFTETRPSQPVLAPPDGWVARMSLPRDLAGFWNDRERLLDEAARGSLAEFQNNLGILMGGLTVEDLFAGLGSAFDVYLMRGEGGAPGHRYPSAALVAVLVDPDLKTELLMSFQTTMGIVNAQRAQERLPRFFQESTRHRDVLIASARYLPESLPDPADDRLQLEPSLATVGDRLILGTNRKIVRALVDQVLDGKTRPRAPGDELEISGPAAAAALQEAGAIVRSQMVLKEGRTEESAREVVDMIASVLARIDRVTAAIDLEGSLATVSVRVLGARLLEAPESR